MLFEDKRKKYNDKVFCNILLIVLFNKEYLICFNIRIDYMYIFIIFGNRGYLFNFFINYNLK